MTELSVAPGAAKAVTAPGGQVGKLTRDLTKRASFPVNLEPALAARGRTRRHLTESDDGTRAVEQQPAHRCRVRELAAGEPESGAQCDRVGEHSEGLARIAHLDADEAALSQSFGVHEVHDRDVGTDSVRQEHGLVAWHHNRADRPAFAPERPDPFGCGPEPEARRNKDDERPATPAGSRHRARADPERLEGHRLPNAGAPAAGGIGCEREYAEAACREGKLG